MMATTACPISQALFRGAPPDAALEFIERLAGDADTECCFRTFSDRERGGGRKYIGALRTVWPSLYSDQLEGRGVFILPNAGGHTDAEIHTIRAIWLDSDGPSLSAILDRLEADGLTPHLLCRREDKPDAYWHLYILTEGLSPAEFRAVQRALAKRYGTDLAVCNPSRVMRLPGTFNLKPGLAAPARYTLDDWTFGDGRAVAMTREKVVALLEPEPECPRQSSGEPVTLAMLRDMLRCIDPGIRRSEGWLAVLSALYSARVTLADGKTEDPDYDGRELAIEWSRGDFWPDGQPANFEDEDDVANEWDVRARSTRADLPNIGALINLAKAGGYEGPGYIQRPAQEVLGPAYIQRPAQEVFAEQLKIGRPAGLFGGAPSINAAAVEPQPLHFLWYPYLVAGRINIIGGRGGSGKGLVAAHATAAITTEGKWPCGRLAPQGRVLWGETEDPIAEVLVPRLDAAGADRSQVQLINPGQFTFDGLTKLIQEYRPKLVVFSPLVSFLKGLVDFRDEMAVRNQLEQLQAVLEETGAALLGIGHLNKKPDLAAIERLLGSVAFANFVRSVLLVAPEHENMFRLVHAKHNVSVKGSDWCYQPTHVGEDRRSQHVRLEWTRPDSNIDADTMFDRRKPTEGSALAWLIERLQDAGEVDSRIILNEAEEAGHSKDAVKQARKRAKHPRIQQRWGRAAGESVPCSLWYLVPAGDDQ